MTYEPYDPSERRITTRTHGVAWLVFGLLIGIVAISDPLTERQEGGSQVAVTDHMIQDCG